MAVNLIKKLLTEAVQTGGTYAEFVVSDNTIAFICDGGSRRSTRNYRQTKDEIKADEKVLKTVSEKSLLFSGQLKRIKITFLNGRTAVFQKTDDNDICTITARKATESKEKHFDYVCFTSESDPCTGIAFAVKPLKNGRHQIIPCTGVVMNGPNITDMHTDLQFVISGNFHVQDGVPDINDSEANREAAEDLAAVMEYAVTNVLRLVPSRMPLFSILPNTMDEESLINSSLIQAVQSVCRYHPLFKNRKGTIVSRNSIALGTDEVTNLFTQEIAVIVLGDKNWIEPCEAGSREERFLIDVGIPYYDRERFLNEFFRKENLDDCSKILEEQNDRWIRLFYILCSGPAVDESTKRLIVSGFKSIQSIRDSKRFVY